MNRRARSRTLALLFLALPTFAGCGDDESLPPPVPSPTATATPVPTALLIPFLPNSDNPYGRANAVSGDGSVVVGQSSSAGGLQAFRWTTSGELQGLGFLPGYTASSEALALSADGSVVVGMSTGDNADTPQAFIWTASAGMQPLGRLPEFLAWSQAAGVSADGTMVVGSAGTDPTAADAETFCFLWTEAAGFRLNGDFLPSGAGNTYCVAHAISADGRVVVGEARYDVDSANAPISQAFRLTPDLGLFPLGWVSDSAPYSRALSTSANGSVIGGDSDFLLLAQPLNGPMRWTTTGGPMWLARSWLGHVYAVSANGTAMAGGAADPGTAFLWDVDNGFRNLYGVLQESGLVDGLEGNSPESVTGMSADGRVVVGIARGDGSARAFYVRLP
jgi:probable HAF family extracellular repeat protein